MNNIVFLDVDGILTYAGYNNDDTANIDPKKVKLLAEICEKANAKVVIISSWRGSADYTPPMYYVLTDILKKYNIDVIDDAPYVPAKLENYDSNASYNFGDLQKVKVKHGTGRAAEVNKYIYDNHIKNFVILDDGDFSWKDYGYDTHWIRPTYFSTTHGGLQPEHVTQAIQILQNKNL